MEDFHKAHKLQEEIETLKSGEKAAPDVAFSEVLKSAARRALGGGIAGATAMIVQVTTLMWMRYSLISDLKQDYYELSIPLWYHDYSSVEDLVSQLLFKHRYAEGGVARFYRGITPALFQVSNAKLIDKGPLSRFGDTAANVGMLQLLDSQESTRNMPIQVYLRLLRLRLRRCLPLQQRVLGA